MTHGRPWRVLALVTSLTLVLAACGGDDEEESDGGGDGGDGGGESAFEQLDMSGITVSVGSKDFTEQLVLGEILAQSFEAAGAEVENNVNLGGTQVNRDALLNGEIDTYAEYNGTGWTEHLGNENPAEDPDELTQAVRDQDLEENSIHWLGQSEFNNTYGFATGPEFTEEENDGEPFTVESMAQYLEDNPDTTVCMESEFPDRSDGLVRFEDATGYEMPTSQQEIMDTGIIYNETAQGNCDFGEIFTTDGRIPALDLSVVEDEQNVFILYNVSINVRDGVYQEAPEAFDQIAEDILAPLDDERMMALNSRVAVDGDDAAEVAGDYLVEEGLVSG